MLRATTDSGKEIKYKPESKAGISNLLLIYSALTNKKISEIEKKYIGRGYAQFKKDLAEVVIKTLLPFRQTAKKISATMIKNALSQGNKKANMVAEKKIGEVKKTIGLTI